MAICTPNENNQVLLGQFTADLNSGATGIEGELGALRAESNGVVIIVSLEFKHPIPAPSALPLLAVAGLIGRRRRRLGR